MGNLSRRSAWALPGAILLSLVIAGEALAFTWSPRIPLTSSGGGFPFAIAGVNGTTAVAAYVEWNGSWYDVKVKRTTTMGVSWTAPITLSTDGYSPDIDARDPFVDVVYEHNGRVRYRRSVNSGMSYSSSIALSPVGKTMINLSVARGEDGLVVVAYQNINSMNVLVRVSTDGGVTFGPQKVFASDIQDETAVAAGDGVVYLAYKTEYNEILLHRSTDGGTNWSAPFTVTTNGYGLSGGQLDMDASGTHAYIAYSVKNKYHPAWGAVKYRRSINSGASWSDVRPLAPPNWKTESIDIDLKSGTLRAAYNKRGSVYGSWYQQTTDGLNWAAPEFVDAVSFDPAVTKAGNIIVLFQVGTGDAYVRLGT